MTPPRNGTLDYAKLLAAFGIVWFHTGAQGASYGYAGLGFFLIMLVLFTSTQNSFTTFATNRATRLLLPWLACCALYGGLKLLEITATSATLETEFDASMWLTGPAIHLWFLPFAFAVSLILYPLIRATQRLPALPVTLGFSLLTLVTLALQTPLPVPLAQWTYALPALCLGLCILFAGGGVMHQLIIIGSIGTIALAAGWDTAPQLLLAGLLVALCCALPTPATVLSSKMGHMALTVYLLHPLVAATLARIVDTPSNSVTFASLTILLTTALAHVIHTAWPKPKPQLRGYLPQA